MVLTPLEDPGKTMVEPHFILQGFRLISLLYLGKFFKKESACSFLWVSFLVAVTYCTPEQTILLSFIVLWGKEEENWRLVGSFLAVRSLFRQYHHRNISKIHMNIWILIWIIINSSYILFIIQTIKWILEFDCRSGLQLTVIGFFLEIFASCCYRIWQIRFFNLYQIMMTNFTIKRFTGSMACRNCVNKKVSASEDKLVVLTTGFLFWHDFSSVPPRTQASNRGR